MSELGASHELDELELVVPQVEIEDPEHPGLLSLVRVARKVGGLATRVVLSALLTAGGLALIDVGSARIKYPPNQTEIGFVAGTEQQATDGSEYWVVAGGMGQVDSKKPAEQFDLANQAAGARDPVIWIQYKNQGIDGNDAFVLEHFLKEHHIKRVGIVGVSMGLPIALDWFQRIAKAEQERGEPIDWKIEDIVAYSSPFDDQDPWKRDLLRKGVATHYPFGMITKYLYNLDWNTVFGEDVTNDARADALQRAWDKMMNHTPPALFASQAKFLVDADVSTWATDSELLTDNVTFTYLIGEFDDDTVDAKQAANKYFAVFGVAIGATWHLIKVVGAGHADTARSAEAMTDLLKDEHNKRLDSQV